MYLEMRLSRQCLNTSITLNAAFNTIPILTCLFRYLNTGSHTITINIQIQITIQPQQNTTQ